MAVGGYKSRPAPLFRHPGDPCMRSRTWRSIPGPQSIPKESKLKVLPPQGIPMNSVPFTAEALPNTVQERTLAPGPWSGIPIFQAPPSPHPLCPALFPAILTPPSPLLPPHSPLAPPLLLALLLLSVLLVVLFALLLLVALLAASLIFLSVLIPVFVLPPRGAIIALGVDLGLGPRSVPVLPIPCCSTGNLLCYVETEHIDPAPPPAPDTVAPAPVSTLASAFGSPLAAAAPLANNSFAVAGGKAVHVEGRLCAQSRGRLRGARTPAGPTDADGVPIGAGAASSIAAPPTAAPPAAAATGPASAARKAGVAEPAQGPWRQG